MAQRVIWQYMDRSVTKQIYIIWTEASAKALTLQQFTDRPNNDRRSLGSLELIMWLKF